MLLLVDAEATVMVMMSFAPEAGEAAAAVKVVVEALKEDALVAGQLVSRL
jgi:hypothetical protein